MTARGGVAAAAVGCALFVAACTVPHIGLFSGQLGTSRFQTYGDRTLAGSIPYRDFSLEYPPGALPAFVVPSLGPERDYDSWFMSFEVACGLVCVAVVGAVTRSRAAAAYAALAPLALGPLTLHRYDLWAAALATAAVAAVAAGWARAGFAALAAGAAAKLFPAILVPVALVRVGRRNAVHALAWFLAILLLVAGPFLVLGAGGVRFSVEQQTGRALQLESVASSALLAAHAAGAYSPRVVFGDGSWNLSGRLPDALATLSTALQFGAVAAVWLLYARGPRTRGRFFLAAAAAVAAWVALGKVLSPQFLLWLVPLVALVRRPRYALVLLVALALTRAVYPARYDDLVDLQTLPIALLGARNVLLLALAGLLALDLQRQRVLEEVRAEHERARLCDAVVVDRGERNGPDGVPGVEPGSRH